MSAAIVMFHGSLDITTKKETSDVLKSVSQSSQVTLDLSDVDVVDSSFFATFVSVYRERLSRQETTAIRVIAPDKVQKLFHVVGLARCVELYAEGDKRAADIRQVELLGTPRMQSVRNAEVLMLQ